MSTTEDTGIIERVFKVKDVEITLRIRSLDDYVDVRELANAYDKHMKEWVNLPSTKKLQEHYQQTCTVQIHIVNNEEMCLWIHPKLVFNFVIWIDPEVAPKIFQWIQDCQVDKSTKVLKEKIQTLEGTIDDLNYDLSEGDMKYSNLKHKVLGSAYADKDRVLLLVSNEQYVLQKRYKLVSTTSKIENFLNVLNASRIGEDKFIVLKMIRAPQVDLIEKFIKFYLRNDLKDESWIVGVTLVQLRYEIDIIEMLCRDMPNMFENFELLSKVCDHFRDLNEASLSWVHSDDE